MTDWQPAPDNRFPARAHLMLAIATGGTFVCLACAEKVSEPAATAAPSARPAPKVPAAPLFPPEPTGPLAATFAGQKVSLTHGRVRLQNEELKVELSSAPLRCTDAAPKAPSRTLSFGVPAGPERGFFARQVIGADLRVEQVGAKDKPVTVLAHQTRLSIAEAKLGEGGRIRGRLSFAAPGGYGAGQFDVPLCPPAADDKPQKPLAVRVDPAKLVAAFGGAAFRVGTALATVSFDPVTKSDHLSAIELFDEKNVQCQFRHERSGRMIRVKLSYPARVERKGFQPIAVELAPAKKAKKPGEGELLSLGRHGWLSVTQSPWVGGGIIAGTLLVQSGSKDARARGKLAGHFSAQVCRPGDPLGHMYKRDGGMRPRPAPSAAPPSSAKP